MTGFLSFHGRRARLSHIAFSALCAAVAMLVILADVAGLFGPPSTLARVATNATLLAIVLLVQICATAQRCRDLSIDGWWALLLAVPAVGAVFWLFVAILPGKRRGNRYGPMPGRGDRYDTAGAA